MTDRPRWYLQVTGAIVCAMLSGAAVVGAVVWGGRDRWLSVVGAALAAGLAIIVAGYAPAGPNFRRPG